MRKQEPIYTPEQIQEAEQVAKQFAIMPKKTRSVAVMVADAFLNGLLVGQEIRKNVEKVTT